MGDDGTNPLRASRDRLAGWFVRQSTTGHPARLRESTFGWPLSISLAVALPIAFLNYRAEVVVLAARFLYALWRFDAMEIGRLTGQRWRSLAWFVLFGAWAMMASAWSPAGADGLRDGFKLVVLLGGGYLFVGWMGRLAPTAAEVRRAILYYGAGLAVTSLLVLIHRVTDGAMMGWILAGVGSYSHLSDANPVATASVLFAAPAVLVARKAFGRRAAAIVLLLHVVIVLAAISTAAQLGLVCGLAAAFLVALLGKRLLPWIALVAIMAVLALPLLALLGDQPFLALVDAASRRLGADASISVLHRAHIYDFALAGVAEHPLLGWGMNASPHLPHSQDSIPGLHEAVYMPRHPHNLAFQVWLELGLVGALLLAATIRAVFQIIRSRLPVDAAAAMAGTAMSYFVISMLAYKAWASWWIATAVLAAAVFAPLLRALPAPCAPMNGEAPAR